MDAALLGGVEGEAPYQKIFSTASPTNHALQLPTVPLFVYYLFLVANMNKIAIFFNLFYKMTNYISLNF